MKTFSENHKKYYNFLSRLALFKGVGEEDLNILLRAIQIRQYYRGEMVTFNSKEHANCYVVYDGLFKITKIDKSGNEAIIKIVHKRDTVLPMYFSKHYDICAEFVRKTTLLYFDKCIIDEFSFKNHQFMLNIVNLLAEDLQSLMLSVESLQLKTAKEKVGQYLVRTKVDGTFKLPCSYSLIASYLGMRPESFSRALVELKLEGVVLKNKSITLEKGDDLCQYCDKVTASNCASFKSKECLHN